MGVCLGVTNEKSLHRLEEKLNKLMEKLSNGC